MEYTIITHPDYTQACRVGVSLQPDNEPLKFFLSAIRLERFSELLTDAAKKEGYRGDPAGLIFYGDLDGEGFATGEGFDPGQVKVYHHVFGESLVSESLFLHILHDYARILLVEYRDSPQVPADWAIRMETAIDALARTLPQHG